MISTLLFSVGVGNFFTFFGEERKTMQFTDGMKFNLKGDLRIVRRKDGYYVVGEKMLCPVRDMEDGLNLISGLRSSRENKQ